jgi:hypothetical protein
VEADAKRRRQIETMDTKTASRDATIMHSSSLNGSRSLSLPLYPALSDAALRWPYQSRPGTELSTVSAILRLLLDSKFNQQGSHENGRPVARAPNR